MMHRPLLCLVVMLAGVARAEPVRVDEANAAIRLACRGTTVTIDPRGFRFAFERDGRTIAAHAMAGVTLDGRAVTAARVVDRGDDVVTLDVRTDDRAATVAVRFATDAVTFDLASAAPTTFALQLAGVGAPAFGLGDHGGLQASTALRDVTLDVMRNDGGHGKCRFVSTFAIFPRARFAGVLFHPDRPGVAITPDAYRLTAPQTTKARAVYFFGEPPAIYAAYRAARNDAGYPDVVPHFRLFELGWESWDALRWRADQQTVRETLQHYLDRGYPIRWAVTGSGFWIDGGTTTSFGQWHPTRWPDPAGFKAWLASHDIKWMIGQRTNFGGHDRFPPYTIGPFTADLRARDLFTLDHDGKPLVVRSHAFPRADCLMLDGAKPGAASWFADQYAKWNVDGVKEDTMMGLDRIDLFNAPMRELHERGQLVMARCAAFSVPGSLIRSEDQKKIEQITDRIPLTFLQQAASAAPNVYVDTVGWGVMNTDVRGAMRQAWFNALTAGFAVGAEPGATWTDADRAALDKAVWFRHALAPYLYSAAVDAARDGYPHTLTPLPIAFPDDANVDDLASKDRQQFEWLVGPSLLAAPFLHGDYQTNDRADVYLPAGEWIDFESGERFAGSTMLKDHATPIDRVPAFVGGPAILVLRDRDDRTLRGVVYPNSSRGATYRFTHTDGKTTTTIVNHATRIDATTRVVSPNSTPVVAERDPTTGAIRFTLGPAGLYELRDQ